MDIRKRGSERFQTALASLCLRVQSPKDLTRPFINVLAHSHGRAQIIERNLHLTHRGASWASGAAQAAHVVRIPGASIL